MIRSAHSTNETKMAGLPNFAPQWLKSISVTPRAREHDPQEKTGMCFVRILSRVSLSDGHPTGMIWSAVAFRIRYVASPVRSKKQALQRRWSFWASDAAWRHVRRTGTGRVPNCALENSILTLKSDGPKPFGRRITASHSDGKAGKTAHR